MQVLQTHAGFAQICSFRKKLQVLQMSLTLSKKVHIKIGMNKLPLAKRVQILSMLCEGSSMRSISRIADVSINTVAKLLVG